MENIESLVQEGQSVAEVKDTANFHDASAFDGWSQERWRARRCRVGVFAARINEERSGLGGATVFGLASVI